MVRVIKFRAKAIREGRYDGKWIYGNLHQDLRDTDENFIFPLHANGRRVDYKTVGQFTGLHDKDGKEIYEGDIVECVSWNEYFSDGSGKPMDPFRRKMYVGFRKGGFKMVEPMPEPMKDNEWDIIYNGDIKVVGNIHDNPKLLNREGDTPMPVLPHKFNVGDTIRMKDSIAWSFTITDICKDSYIGKGFSLKFEVADMDWELVEEKKED